MNTEKDTEVVEGICDLKGVSAAAACAAVGRVRGADQPLLCWASLPEPAPQASTMPLRSTDAYDVLLCNTTVMGPDDVVL